ncbi:MAG: M48 family metallopeptidase [Clostridia bacterium]|nr:M48 family metallopeptidase [Clostridia bacterium]
MNLVRRKVSVKSLEIKGIERHPVPLLGMDYKVKIIYKNTKITELDVEKNIIKISLPNRYKKMNKKEILDLAIDKMYEQIAKVEIERAMEKTRIMLGFAPEEYEIKKIKKLGVCQEQKITIHPELVKYSRKVIDYVILHQYCHLKHKNHTKAFLRMLESYFPDYKKCEEILLNIS